MSNIIQATTEQTDFIESLDSMIKKNESISNNLETIMMEEKFLKQRKQDCLKEREEHCEKIKKFIEQEQTVLITENNALKSQISELELEMNRLKEQLSRNCERYNVLESIKPSFDYRGL
jgi:chromosome segregation ATPase